MNMVFCRSTGRMMKEIEYKGMGAAFYADGASVCVKAHPRSKDYSKMMAYEKNRKFLWPEDWVYRSGISAPLDLFEHSEW